jgi:hypothetical protein
VLRAKHRTDVPYSRPGTLCYRLLHMGKS